MKDPIEETYTRTKDLLELSTRLLIVASIWLVLLFTVLSVLAITLILFMFNLVG